MYSNHAQDTLEMLGFDGSVEGYGWNRPTAQSAPVNEKIKL
jgi:hypothetical protein